MDFPVPEVPGGLAPPVRHVRPDLERAARLIRAPQDDSRSPGSGRFRKVPARLRRAAQIDARPAGRLDQRRHLAWRPAAQHRDDGSEVPSLTAR